MSKFTQLSVKLPIIPASIVTESDSFVSTVNSDPIIQLLDLPWSNSVIHAANAYIPPRRCISIHKDMSIISGVFQIWNLLLPIEGYTPPAVSIYSAIDNTVTTSKPYEHYEIPCLPINNAILKESYDVKNGPVFFSSGTEWHGTTNNTDEIQRCFVIRSAVLPMQDIYTFLSNRWR